MLNLQALDEYQDGDVSQAQIDSFQTQALVTLARIEAAPGRGWPPAASSRSRRQRIIAESARRQAAAYIERNVECRAVNGPLSYWQQPTTAGSPEGGVCHTVEDRTAVGVANLIASELSL